MEELVYNGVTLSDLCTVIDVRRPLPTMRADFESLTAADRIAHRGSGIVPPTLSFTLVLDGRTDVGRRELVRRLAPILLVKDPVKVSFGSDGGKYYEAVLDGEIDLEEFIRSGSLTVSMKALQAAMYGVEKSMNVPSGGGASFTVYGTYPTALRIHASAAVRNQSSRLWGVRLDGGDYARVDTGTDSAVAVNIDCEAREAKIGSTTAMITLDSDWLVMEPGMHSVENDIGSGGAVLSWIERWI